jgi:hypothetical protein
MIGTVLVGFNFLISKTGIMTVFPSEGCEDEMNCHVKVLETMPDT